MLYNNDSTVVQGRRGSAIVYDLDTQTVSTRKFKRMEGITLSNEQPAPKWSSHVDICVDQAETKRVAATLNLDKLGWVTNLQRMCGKFSGIYVISSPGEVA